MTPPHVAVVGGGYSGTLQAIQLLDRGARVTLIERADRLARGVAYSTRHADHLLNVRACKMSAFPDPADHFATWLAGQSEGAENSFAQRRSYGRYLAGLLEEARNNAGGRLSIVGAEVQDVTAAATGERVELGRGERIAADAVVLALGNLPPETPRGISADSLADGIFHADPWSADLAAGLDANDTILLVGTGLTAIDAALILDSAGFGGRILALSRRGLLPRAHAEQSSGSTALDCIPATECTDLLRFVRAVSEQVGWQAAVDSLRPVTQAIWAGAGLAERQRFLRHLRPWWDVHRHRIAPSIAARVEKMIAQGRLEVAAGKIISVKAADRAALLRWRPRGRTSEESVEVRRIVNCTGPQSDITRAGEPLLDALLSAGRIRPDPCRIGVHVDQQCRTISAAGPSQTLRAVGPISKGAFWEVVAVPDIRQQVRDVAEFLIAR